jgi:hypothetical protein
VEHGKTLYEVESKERTISRDLLYFNNGEVSEIEESIIRESLPAAVKAALEKQFANYKFVKGEKVMQGTNVEYDLQVKSDNKKWKIVSDAPAKIIKMNGIQEKKNKKENNEKRTK